MSSKSLSSNNHECPSSSSSSTSTSLKIGIVGFGSFAQFLAKTILKQGHTLSATSRSDYSLLCSDLGISFFREVDGLLEADNDVVMICTSILSFEGVVNSMPFHRLRRPTLFVDVLSVKEHPRRILIKALPDLADLLCTHPMFGPESGKNGWRNLPFMFERVRISDHSVCSSFIHIFESEGCRMLEMSCEEHDQLAARSQFLTHTVGRTLEEMEIKSTSINTKGFETLLQLKESTARDSFDLFKGLFVYNRFAKVELKNLEMALDRVRKKLQEEGN